MKALTPITLKVPLHESLRTLSDILEKAEANEGEIPDDMLPALKSAEAGITETVDGRLSILESVKVTIEQIQTMERALKKRKATLTKLEDTIKARTFKEMSEAGKTKLNGNFGSFVISGNAERKVAFSIPLHEMENIIDPHDIDKVDERYLSKLTVFVLDVKTYIRHLREGKVVQCFSGAPIFDVRPDAEACIDDEATIKTHIATIFPQTQHLKVYQS